jgi:hypothetical protein
MRHGMKHPYSTDHPVPARGRRSSKMRWGLAIVASSSMIFGMASVSGAAPPAKQTVDVFRIDGEANEGTATLTRTDSGVSMRISTTVGGLMWDLPFAPPVDPISPDVGASWEVGDATTNWFVVFNNPGNCTPEPAPQNACSEDDVRAGIADFMDGEPYEGGPAGASVHFAAGHVAGSSTWRAAGSLREGDTSRWLFPSVPLDDAMTAEVHIIVHPHGQMTDIMPGERGKALNTVDGGCGTNICGDAQAAIFAPPA